MVFMARDSMAVNMLRGVSLNSSFELAQMNGGTKSMGLVFPRTQLKVLGQRETDVVMGGLRRTNSPGGEGGGGGGGHLINIHP